LLSFSDLGELVVPLRALVVAALGAGAAWCWYNDWRWLAIVAPIAVVLAGGAAGTFGSALLPGHPLAAVRMMEWRLLVPAALATLASAVLIIATIELTLPDKPAPPTEAKQLVATLSSAITAFLTASFISWAGDDKDSGLADWIRGRFQDAYKQPRDPGGSGHFFKAQSRGELLVYSDPIEGISGWGRTARRKRADAIAAEIRSGASNP
jgi:hypothetical protein